MVTSLVRTDLLFLSAAIFISVFEQKLHLMFMLHASGRRLSAPVPLH